ncbi:Basic proline-rich protein precursor [Myxococcus hansupus]|uniref:Basic proline-rich protein n=1 Tax=Pseudomyxococcus hansupus TaxID=1297742 RepID=A0A0H4WVB2_9BACT|nr:Basic proline-rich protein precursor [Myxococcus hansupus]
MPKNLLVADDSLTIRKVIGMIFATEDFQVTAVDNGLDAISRTRELRPDVVLADVMMPGKSGYEVCEALKNDPATQGIPVMLLAGTFEAFDENRARAARADDHVTKPFESQVLLDKVKALVGQKSNTMPASFATQVRPPSAQPAAPAPQPVAAAPQPPVLAPGRRRARVRVFRRGRACRVLRGRACRRRVRVRRGLGCRRAWRVRRGLGCRRVLLRVRVRRGLGCRRAWRVRRGLGCRRVPVLPGLGCRRVPVRACRLRRVATRVCRRVLACRRGRAPSPVRACRLRRVVPRRAASRVLRQARRCRLRAPRRSPRPAAVTRSAWARPPRPSRPSASRTPCRSRARRRRSPST